MSDISNAENPSSTFHCKTLLWQQTYSLYRDRITVDTVHRFSGHSQATYLLSSLSPHPTRGTSRGEGLNWGILLMFLGFGLTAWHSIVGYSDYARVPMIQIVMAGAGLFWFIISLRQWRYAIFSSSAGVEVLSLWSTHKTVGSFDPFVNACVSAIEGARDQKSSVS